MNHTHFFSFDIEHHLALPSDYNLSLVFISYLVATIAGFCFSSICQYISIHPNNDSKRWLQPLGGVVLGLGIWSMHFVGMLAFSLPLEIKYDLSITLLSVLPAIIGATITIIYLHHRPRSLMETAFAALMLASGIAVMHFTGMAAMNLHATMVHDPTYFVLSILLSWLLAIIGLVIQLNNSELSSWLSTAWMRTLAVSATFGFCVATMHYLAMRSAFFFPTYEMGELPGLNINYLAIGVIIGSVMLVLGMGVILAFKKRIYVLDTLANTHQTYMADTIDNMSDPFLLCDQKGTILLINHSFYYNFEKLSFNPGERLAFADIVNDYIKHYVKFENDQEKMLLLNQIANGKPCRFQAKNDEWWLLRQQLTDSLHQIITWTNVTNQVKQHEALIEAKDETLRSLEKLQQTQRELAEANKLASVTKLVTNVAHELNTPLGIAVTANSSMKNLISDTTRALAEGKLKKEELESALTQLLAFEDLGGRNVERAAEIIRQFKYIAISEFNEPLLQLDLANLLKEMADYYRNEANTAGVRITTQLPDSIVIKTFEDPLQQVLRTLFANALLHAFTDKIDGQLQIFAQQNEQIVEVDVKDNGVGIDQSVLQELFEPFVSSRKLQGSIGLGLHIAYNLVKYKLNAKLELIHSDEDGTHFKLSLPVSIDEE